MNTPDMSEEPSRPATRRGHESTSYSALDPSVLRTSSLMQTRRYFKSYRLKGEYEKEWLKSPKVKKTKWNTWIVSLFLFLGLASGGVYCLFALKDEWSQPMCLIYEDDFQTIDMSAWSYEVQIDGFGTGSFDWTTTDPKNAYVDADGLHIVPTLTNETTDINNDMLYNGYTLNLTAAGGDGSCTGTTNSACSIRSNSTFGSMVPPVRSARLSTKGKKNIQYGRVEVVAKLPRGDWLWPAIWMMPEDSVYGDWPRSGEIDIMESRGNNYTYVSGGSDVFSSSLHWGPNPAMDGYWRTTSVKQFKRGDFADEYHAYGIVWSDKYIYSYVDTRLMQVLYVDFSPKDDLWTLGKFQGSSENSTIVTNPWLNSTSTTGNAPFDQKFYLILNVAVGSRNGWFPDDKDGKPWLDDATDAQWMFYSNVDEWLPTWGPGDQRGMTVKSVKMWQQGACGGDL